ncbi:XdhC family protein [Deinococcus pimensis]|uniref:XdhC family protein n=1 Tax=Deinococcus pimensis TaxID=309888 RepID=UPI0006945D3B|nr:XdhC family protein [Deinococcus pimensis]
MNTPPPELVVFGAGHDALPLAAHAGALGYDVRVVDAREGFLTRGRFPGATLDLLSPDEFGAHLRLGPRSHVVIMNHHLDRDRESLRHALASPAPYVGVLGPRSRFERLLGALHEEGFTPTPAQLARVRSPVGLRVGAETPDEVALSIVAELMALRRGQSGGFLAGHEGRIHERTAEPSVAGTD